MKNYIWQIIGVFAVIAISASIVYSNKVASDADENIVFQEHIKGNAEASVILTEFSDFQCPACAQFVPAIEKVLEDYGDEIRFEYKHFPLVSIHANAIPAAKAAEAAGQQGKFFQMHDALFENQSAWADAPNPQVFFVQYAQDIGLDIEQFKKQMKSSKINEKIENEMHQAQELGLRGTPTFFLNGERMQFKTFGDFTTLIEAAIVQRKEDKQPQESGEALFEEDSESQTPTQ